MSIEEYDIYLERFEEDALQLNALFLVVGRNEAVKNRVIEKYISYKPSSVVITGSKRIYYLEQGIDNLRIFNRYSTLMKNKIFVKDRAVSLIFDDAVYNKAHMSEFYSNLSKYNVSFLVSQSFIEHDTLFDYIFICSVLEEHEIDNLIKKYGLDLDISEIIQILEDCIENSQILVIHQSKLCYLG
jgi:hypothetical protein